jgi:hypothetical protein
MMTDKERWTPDKLGDEEGKNFLQTPRGRRKKRWGCLKINRKVNAQAVRIWHVTKNEGVGEHVRLQISLNQFAAGKSQLQAFR